jgi:isoquinoline 1-oxidoreductase beta subunit
MSATLRAPLGRRSFLKLATLAGGGLVLGYYVRPSGMAQVVKPDVEKTDGLFIPNAFLRIAADGSVTVYSPRPEVGQGIKTSLPMIIAEELGADWRRVEVVSAPLDAAFGPQFAGGSMSTPMSYTAMRQVGAAARTMLVEAAAQTWGVPANECVAGEGAVRHAPSGRSLKFGDLVAKASALPVPAEGSVVLKDPKDFTLLGKRIGGVDNPRVVTGQPLFGIDQKRPGMVHAVYEKSPVWGARPLSANLDHVKALPGVVDAFAIDRTVPEGQLTGLVPGVAIVATSTWAAFSARNELKVTWKEGRLPNSSWDDFARQARELARAPAGSPGVSEDRRDGDVDKAFAGAAHVLEAAYAYPFHFAHEPGAPELPCARAGGQGRDLGPDPEPGRRAQARRAGARVRPREREGQHHPHRRRFRPEARLRPGRGGGRDLAAPRRPGEAPLGPRERPAARPLQARRVSLPQGRGGPAGRAERVAQPPCLLRLQHGRG